MASAVARKSVSELSDQFRKRVSEDCVDSAQVYLDGCGPTTMLAFLLRMRSRFFDEIGGISEGRTEQLDSALVRSLTWGPDSADNCEAPLAVVRREWEDAVGSESVWRSVLEFRGIHGCALRGPVAAFRRFFQKQSILGPQSPISAIVRPSPVAIPEQVADLGALNPLDKDLLYQVQGLRRRFLALEKEEPDKIVEETSRLLGEPEVVAALDWFQRFIGGIPFGFRRRTRFGRVLEQILGLVRRQHEYIDRLGIGSVSSFGDSAGQGQVVCMLDSGADESHPILQQQVKDYVRFDALSQQKEAYACMDFACHGTSMASLICGQPVTLFDLGLTADYVGRYLGRGLAEYGLREDDAFRIGVAPGAKVAVVGVLGGEPLAETGTLSTVLAGLDWAASNHSKIGYQVVNIAIEANRDCSDEHSRRGINAVLNLMKRRGIVPVAAAGNHQLDSAPIGTAAYVVGAADPHGNSMESNGVDYDLLAPGSDLVCAQPGLDRLGNLLVGVYSGSSIATAVVSGCIALLCARHGIRAGEAIAALIETATDKQFISLDRASSRFA